MKRAISFLLVLALPRVLQAAVGCDLNDPDRDVRRLFPGATGYRTEYVSVDKKGGESLLAEIEGRLGDGFSGLYETKDVPYTMYRIYRGKELAGYIHGVNQKGRYGGIQVFLALDTNGVIKSLYFQKLTSKAATKLREKAFGLQFSGLSLGDFYGYDIRTGKAPEGNPVNRIKNPSPGAYDDFRAAMRAVKKNLILVDEFLLGNRHLRSSR